MLAFDIISDLHLSVNDNFCWEGQATAPICLVLGDICRDHHQLQQVLTTLRYEYATVLYIDGNEEHKDLWPDFQASHQSICQVCRDSDVVYLYDNMVVINGVGFVGTNGWWTWDFDTGIDPQQLYQWFVSTYRCHSDVPALISRMAEVDTDYLGSCVRRAQTMPDVNKLVLATHTVPVADIILNDIDFAGSYKCNVMGNSLMFDVHALDTQHKISHWCFGHYHGLVDQYIGNTRLINNCRGRSGSAQYKSVYFPRRVEV